MDLYIYYRVPSNKASLLQRQVLALQAMLKQGTGVSAELKRRPQELEGKHTWMEIYRDVPPDFERVLNDTIATAGLDDVIEGERHSEHFMDFSSCA
ncbi:hypothetical protein FHW67_001261 [Herbaspirillum sp. Sphag1AN]|uniref:DUF4936 family protein n=1 Tax=unclassified Herbaspirillum TaxID=2624150 RepID=UPI00161A62BE|nr:MULTISPECIES: DUF4936 family protein [unclassified Herbaspirillum]MBB3211993.1 hypothetical protein [Herbaspirillum sp. Sphag1AN]MBB3244173.1 hypothetical protein [Herbaspirillum sp. Sphag64]